MILLADARHRVGGIPGLTTSNSPQAARARSVRVELALIGLRSCDLRGHHRDPRLASPGSTTKVETVHPLLSCRPDIARDDLLARPYTCNARGPNEIPAGGWAKGRSRRDRGRGTTPRWPDSRVPAGAGSGGLEAPGRRGRPGSAGPGSAGPGRRGDHENGMTLAGAGGGRSAPARVDRQGRSRSGCPGLPRDETRFLSRRLGRNPPSETQSPAKTPLSSRLVAHSYRR